MSSEIERVRTCLTDTPYERLLPFARDVLGYDRLVAQPHVEMCKFLEESVEPLFYKVRPHEQRRSLLGAPRGTFKTTLGVTALPLWLLVQFPNIRVLLNTHTHKFTKQILYDIKWSLTYNARFKELFGDFSIDSQKWAEDAIIINKRSKPMREPTIDTGAVDAPKTGGHYDVILTDDLINEKTALTRGGLLKSRRYVNTLIPILEPGGCEVFTFTRWAYNDCYGKMLDDDIKAVKYGGQPQYRKLIRGAWLPDGRLYAPTVLPESTLAQLRRDLTDKEFAVWYLNEPIEASSKVFPKSSMHFFRGTYQFDRQPYVEIEVA